MAGVYGNMIIPQKARGGALPEYQGGGAPYTPGAGISARLSGEGGRVAAAAVKAAADADASRGAAAANLARAANNAVQIGLKAYGDYESAVAQNAFNQYQQEEMRLRAELGTLQGRNALGDEGVEARLSRWRADARERLGADLGEIGQRMFLRAADNLDAQSDAWATGKVNKENIAFQNSVSEGSILNARNMALENPADEGALARADGIIKAEYERMASRSGWDDAYRDAKYAEARGKLAFDRAAALIDAGDLDAARRAIGGGAAFRNGGHFTGKLPAEYAELADAEARAQGLPPALAMAVMAQESGGRKDAVSRSGARGLMQLMPGTAKALGVNPDDPRENVRGGVTYLKQMLDHYNGNMEHALMAYNWGPGNMDAWLKTGKGMQGQPMPKETREYASGVLGRIGGDTSGGMQAASKRGPLYVAGTKPEGMVTQGNIDIANRPQVKMDDGGTATVRSMSVNMDGKEVLIPTVSPDGRLLSDDEAIAEYQKTGKHLGMFDTPEHATAYAEKLHEQQEQMYVAPREGGAPSLLTQAQRTQLQARIEVVENRRRAELRVGVGSRLEDGFAALEDGRNAPDMPSDQEIQAVYGDDAQKIIRQKYELTAFSANLQDIRQMTPAQQAELLRREAPQPGEGYRVQAALYAKLERAVAEDAKQREADPAAYLANVDATVARTRNAMFQNFTPESADAYLTSLATAKEERGMTGTMVLPKGDARQIADRVQASDNPVGAIQTMSRAFGRQWPEVMRQIAPEMGNQMNLIASGMGERAGRLLIEAGRDKDFPKQAESLLALKGSDKTEYQNSVRDAMQPFNATLLAGQDSAMAAAVNDAVGTLGLKYMLEGMDKGDAVKKAAEEVVLGRYNLVESGGHVFRAPKVFDADKIYAGAKNALAKVSENPGGVDRVPYKGMGEKRQDASYASMISNNGYWVTSRDENGVMLYVGGWPVLDGEGAPVFRTWVQLEEAGKNSVVKMDDANIVSLAHGGKF